MIALYAAGSLFASVPDLPSLPEIRRTPQVTYVDRSGEVLGVRGGQAAPPVDLAHIPAYVPAAFVAIEDRRFYDHPGFDAIGMGRALLSDLATGRTAQGASTITQQLARNLFLSGEKTVERKATELVYAIELERKYSKRQILALYLSRVYFGSGAYGVEAASRRFFGKPASRLTLREAAALAAVMKSPSGYSPVEQPERSTERTRLVLDAMVETGAITSAQRAKALASPLKVQRADPTAPAQYFVDWVDLQARKVIGKPKQDMVVETTLDLPMETTAARDAVSVADRHAGQDVEQAALVAVDGIGRVRAMVGGVDYGQSQFNRAVQARRQAGSAWKPFVYLTALEQGLTPETVEVDQPVTIAGWSPRNHDNAYLGPVTLQKAIALSINTVAAEVADQVGRDKVTATARRLGITTPISPDPAMALGVSGVSPLEMAQAYDTFSNGGRRASAYGLERIRTAAGQVIWRRPADPHPQVIANPPLSELNGMLRTVLTEGTGVHAAIPRWDLAGKTGTTTDSRDAWFCGFSGGFTSCAWVGRDDDRPMRGVAGGGPPAELWKAFMSYALPRVGATAIPMGPPPPVPAPVLTTVSAPTTPLGQLPPSPIGTPAAVEGVPPAQVQDGAPPHG